jgi:hypothetical protein
MKLNKTVLHIVLLMAFSMALFLPMIGNGFIHDDFIHLYHAGFSGFGDGLLKPSSSAFFTPIANLSFQIDWSFWGGTRPYPLAVENLILHLANILLVYAFALRIWQSYSAALWTAFGFSLLFPANTWAVLWIATRAHILVALFYLLAMHSVLSLAKSERYKSAWLMAALISATCAVLSKESGISILLAAPIMLLWLKKYRLKKKLILSDYVFMGLLLFVFLGYIPARKLSGAIAISFDSENWYSYSVDWKVISENLLRYGWRTYGLLAFVAIALFLKGRFQGLRLRFSFITKSEIFISILLFVFSVAPFLMMRARSGIYSYPAGCFAALLLGAVLNSFEASGTIAQKRNILGSWIPILLLFGVYISFTYGYGRRWVTMAKTNTSVLSQIHAEHPECKPNTVIMLSYSESDRDRRFPEGLAWGFPYALRLMYQDPTLHGFLIKNGDPSPSIKAGPTVCFEYESGSGVHVRKIYPCKSPKIRG